MSGKETSAVENFRFKLFSERRRLDLGPEGLRLLIKKLFHT